MSFNDSLQSLVKGCRLAEEKESFDEYKATYEITATFEPTQQAIEDVFIAIQDTTVTITAYSDDDDFVDCTSTDEITISQFLQEIGDYREKLVVSCSKLSHLHLNIFSSNAFRQHILDNPYSEALQNFSEFVPETGLLAIMDVESSALLTRPENSASSVVRTDIVQKRNEHCQFNNSETITLIPDDFDFLIDSEHPLYDTLMAFRNAMSFTFLLNNSSITKKKIIGTLSGYKKIERDSIDILELSKKDVAFEIYSWAYANRSITESIEIARNIMSLHMRNRSVFDYDDEVLISIKSNYSLIAQQNTRDYLEAKRQIETHISDMRKQSNDVSQQAQTHFYSLLFSFFSLFFTVILITALTSARSDALFNLNMILIFSLFWSIFVVVLLCEVSREKTQRNCIHDGYLGFLKRYEHLFDDSEYKVYKQEAKPLAFFKWSSHHIAWIIVSLLILAFIAFLVANLNLHWVK